MFWCYIYYAKNVYTYDVFVHAFLWFYGPYLSDCSHIMCFLLLWENISYMVDVQFQIFKHEIFLNQFFSMNTNMQSSIILAAKIDARQITKFHSDAYEPKSRLDTVLAKLSKFHCTHRKVPYEQLIDMVLTFILCDPIKSYVNRYRKNMNHWGDLIHYIIKGHYELEYARSLLGAQDGEDL